MARKKATPQWAQEVIDAYSIGELQSGVVITKPVRKRNSREIHLTTQRLPGTRIPASTWNRIKEGTIKPGPKTIKKLMAFKRKTLYNTIRASGGSIKEAKKYSSPKSSISQAYILSEKLRSQAEAMAETLSPIQGKEISPIWIMHNIAKGEKTTEDWDKYITALSA